MKERIDLQNHALGEAAELCRRAADALDQARRNRKPNTRYDAALEGRKLLGSAEIWARHVVKVLKAEDDLHQQDNTG